MQGLQTRVRGIAEKTDEIRNPLQHRSYRDQAIVLAAKMGAGAGPGPIGSPRHEPGRDRIKARVANGRRQVALDHGDRREAALEKVARPSASGIDEVRVAAMRLAHLATKPPRRLGGQDQMDVVGMRQ